VRELIELMPWWVGVFFVIGLLAVGNVVMSLFVSLGRRPPRLRATETPPVTSHEFADMLAGLLNLPVEHGGRARLLNNGDEFFPRLLADIAGARHHIHFMAYLWKDGTISDRILAALEERARAGVQVRLMLDGVGALRAPYGRVRDLMEAGGRVHVFRPPTLGKLTRIHKRNHRRAIVIDGDTAYTGGMAVQDCWLGDARSKDEWRDMMVRVEGCMARGIQSAFTELWAGTTGEVVIGDEYYVHGSGRGEGGPLHITLVSSPAPEKHPLRLFFHLTFMAARRELLIVTPYFAPDPHTRQTLVDRAVAGVDVRILLPNHLTDIPLVRWSARRHYEELLAAGIRIYEYQPTMIHSKAVVVDGLWSIVGSANLDVRSKELNKENVTGILDEGLAGELRDSFFRDLERSDPFELERWRRRPLSSRFKEAITAPFSEQF
jgi:cardiolipin synthase A/B